jgi:hypothetical protein
MRHAQGLHLLTALAMLAGCSFEPGATPPDAADLSGADLSTLDMGGGGQDLDGLDLAAPDLDAPADLPVQPDADPDDMPDDMPRPDDMPDDMTQDMEPDQAVDPCATCAPEAMCVMQPDGARRCECRAGYRGDGQLCDDIDECADGTAGCDPNATCQNTPGAVSCACKPGFGGNGKLCLPSDPCGMCAPQAECADLGNGQQGCRCRTGYEGTGATCLDRDECMDGTAGCSPQAECTNTTGSFTCECLPGFRGDGRSCVDINECDEGSAQCDPLATCQNTMGDYTCVCPPGALPVGNGATCQLLSSCKAIKQQFPNAASGDYVISSPQGALTVRCDMVSDGGAGYTMRRVNNAALGGSQAAYASACSALGLEIIVPRTQEHLESIIAWNNDTPPNIVNVTPRQDSAKGLNNWRGRCRGQDCTFFVSPRAASRCTTVEGQGTAASPYTLWGNRAARSCRDYQDASPTPLSTGVYKVSFNGQPSVNTICEMTLDGGAWTHVATTSDDNQNNWTWDRRELWTTNRQVFGDVSMANRDYKNLGVHDLQMHDAMFLHSPSLVWASYNDVSDGTRAFGQVVGARAAPNCDVNSGFTQSAGTLIKAGKLCDTKLYMNLGDRDGDGTGVRCSVLNLISNDDQSTYGPAWSMDKNDGCPFDDPAESGFGPTLAARGEELDAQGFGAALNANLAPNNSGLNFLQLYVREDARPRPDGDNAQTQRLILNGLPGEIGPACMLGDWDDQGDAVKYTGWVICSTNDA